LGKFIKIALLIFTSSDPKKKSHLCFLVLKAFQIWEKALDLIKQRGKVGFKFFPDFEEPQNISKVNKIN